jgi:Domain of unknown function (DUF4136)
MNEVSRMKRVVICCLLAAAAPAMFAAQMPKYGVTVTADKNVDFATFKTYSWTQGQPSAVKAINAQIVAAVDRELGALGMSKSTSGPGDVMVAYYSLTRTDVNVDAKADAQGKRPEYSVGTLVVALLDPATRHRMLRLRNDKPIETESGKLEAAIDSAVSELFAKYPTRQKK